MKTTKFLPLALSMVLLTSAAFADTSNSATSTLNITVPDYLDITTTNTSITSGVTITGDYETLSLADPFAPKFHVTTNVKGQQIVLSAKAAVTDGDTNGETSALKGAAKPIIAFANTKTDAVPTKANVQSALNGTAINLNPNVIAFEITPEIVPDDTTPASVTATTPGANDVTYTLDNGIYDFTFNCSAGTKGTTFSTHDEAGTYTAKLILSKYGI